MFDTATLGEFSTKPGVYLMRDGAGDVLYVGKAKNLRQRLRQYFIPGRDGRVQVPYLISKVETIETIVVASEKEALLLENNLIKQHQPHYNALLKDDKTYLALKLTHKNNWPMLSLGRFKGKPEADALYFGPYTSAQAARETFEFLNHVFPLRQCSDQELARRTRPCILYDMHRCLAPCVNKCTREEYEHAVSHTISFLRGQNTSLLKQLYHEMEQASAQLDFEEAAILLKRIRAIEKTIEQQHVDTIQGNDIDAIALFRQGEEVMLTIMIIREGKLLEARHYSFSHLAQDDVELLESFLVQHYRPLPLLPHEILLSHKLENGETIVDIISEGKKRKTALHVPLRGDKRHLLQQALENATIAFKKEKDEQQILERALVEIQEKFHLSQYPHRIECFDNSHIAGTEAVASMVTFTEGKKDSKRYRKYKLRQTNAADDYASLEEVLTRRYKRALEEDDLPDLIMIDGGKGHLNTALNTLRALNIVTTPVIAVAKEQGRHDKGMSAERVFIPAEPNPIVLKITSPVLFLLQQIRDEAHRFAISFHRQRRVKGVTTSVLDDIPGIGEVKKKRLLRHFGSLQKLKQATKEELRAVKAITQRDADAIFIFFKGH